MREGLQRTRLALWMEPFSALRARSLGACHAPHPTNKSDNHAAPTEHSEHVKCAEIRATMCGGWLRRMRCQAEKLQVFSMHIQ